MAEITVLQAIYASANKGVDVTKICQGLVDKGNDDIKVNNTTLGGDPDSGNPKGFQITYTLRSTGNAVYAMTAGEGEKLDLVPTPLPPSVNPQPQFIVEKAIFATSSGESSFDVTVECEELLRKNGGNQIPVDHNKLNIPASQDARLLGITYTPIGGGNKGYIVAKEGEVITLTTP